MTSAHKSASRRGRARAEHGLELLRSETNRSILGALERSRSTEAELVAWLVLRNRGKLRRHLETLLSAGVVERTRVGGMRRRVEYSLTEPGVGLIAVIGAVERWLDRHPERRFESVSPVGWRTFGLVIDAWSSRLLQSLACTPRQAEDLVERVEISPGRAKDDLIALQSAGVVTEVEVAGSSAFLLTDWGVRGLVALAIGARWQWASEERPPVVGVENALIALSAALRLVESPYGPEGSCSLTIELDSVRPGKPRSGGLRIDLGDGQLTVVKASAGQSPPLAWVRGTVQDWLTAAIEGRPGVLQVGGVSELPVGLIASLNEAIHA